MSAAVMIFIGPTNLFMHCQALKELSFSSRVTNLVH